MITKLQLEQFTVFKHLSLDFSPGINIIIGENGTGKTHVLKSLYTVTAALNEGKRVSNKIVDVFFPRDKNIGRLVQRINKSSAATVRVWKKANVRSEKDKLLRLHFSNHTKDTLRWRNGWKDEKNGQAIYIPVKEMLANAPGFLALYEKYDLHFEEVYADILHYANLPIPRGKPEPHRRKLLEKIKKEIQGRVVQKKETFYLKNKQGELEFTLLAEGMRKLGLLWLLINNGSLYNGSYLFWDEPETNLNPKLMQMVVGILIELQRMGVQIFLSTHSYVILKEFDLQTGKDDKILFHSLYRCEESKEIESASTDNYLQITPNAIDDTFGNIIDREIDKTMGTLGK